MYFSSDYRSDFQRCYQVTIYFDSKKDIKVIRAYRWFLIESGKIMTI